MLSVILDHKLPLVVVIAGFLTIALTTIPLVDVWVAKSLGALLGTAGSLLLTAGLAMLFTGLTDLTGFSSEEATILQLSGADLSLQGLLLAGIVIGVVGVLDDVTISQSSTVLARACEPRLRFSRAVHASPARCWRPCQRDRQHPSARLRRRLVRYC